MSFGGWVKLYRKTLKSDMYRNLNSVQRDVMINCLMLANHQKNKWEWNGEIFEAGPGQFITSLASLQDVCAKDVSIQNIRTALSKLEKWGFLTNKSTKTGRLITIVNWGKYQGNDTATNKATNKELTKNQQSTNKALTTNKNVKNVKNDKERKKEELNFENFFEKNVDNFEPFLDKMSKGVVLNACKISVKKNRPLKYCEAVLNDWQEKGIQKLEDLKQATKNNNSESDYKWKDFFVKDWDRFKE